jgi:hypothetical protein
VTALELADSGPVPAGFDGVTVNVYVVPLVSPEMLAVVGAGLPGTVVDACAVEPMYGVMVYAVAGSPVVGADQVTVADAYPAVAFTLPT